MFFKHNSSLFEFLFLSFYLLIFTFRCLEMGKSKPSQKSTKVSLTGSVIKKKKSEPLCKCVYNDKEKIQSLAEEVVTEIRDMEQLVNRGEQLSACPYYASREAVKYSQVMYNLKEILLFDLTFMFLYFLLIDCGFTV